MGDDAEHYAMDDGHSAAVVVVPRPNHPASLRATSIPAGALTVSAAALVDAILARHGAGESRPTHVLMLAHNCTNSSCRLPNCRLCEHAVHKRCNKTLATSPTIEPSTGARAPCGATVDVDVVVANDFKKVVDAPPGTCVHLFLVSAAAYEAAVVRKDWRPPPDDVVPVLTTAAIVERQDVSTYHVLDEARGGNRRDITRRANVNSFAAFTVAPQPGHEWNVRPEEGVGRVRLVAALVDVATGALCERVAAAVGESIVVHTQRRRLHKAEIAKVGDAVTVLPGIGLAAAARLASLGSAAAAAQLPPDLHAVRSVGDVKQLAALCSADRAVDNAVRNALSVSRSAWSKAKKAARAAVEPDQRLRAYFTPSNNRGLVFTAADGSVDLLTPVATLTAIAERIDTVPHDAVTLPCPAFPDRVITGHKLRSLGDVAPNELAALTRQARVAWMRAGHPNWTILSGGGRHFDSLRQLQRYAAGRVVAGAPTLEVQVP